VNVTNASVNSESVKFVTNESVKFVNNGNVKNENAKNENVDVNVKILNVILKMAMMTVMNLVVTPKILILSVTNVKEKNVTV
jgi:hypothetical protein